MIGSGGVLHYTVKADTLRVRAIPSLAPAPPILGTLHQGQVIESTLLTAGDLVTGWDDPTTPQPARSSYAWVHLVRGGWVAEAWLEPVRDAGGVAQ